jgi:hypothetical protein
MTKVRMLKQTFWGGTLKENALDKNASRDAFPPVTYYAGQLYDVPETVSARWIQRRIAEVALQ